MLGSKICETSLHQEWVLGLRWKEGAISFFTSGAFEEEVASHSSMCAVYLGNQREVFSLFFDKTDCAKMHRGFAKQMSLFLHKESNPPVTTAAGKLHVGTGHNNPKQPDAVVGIQHQVVDVNMHLGISIINEDEMCACVVFTRFEGGEEEARVDVSHLPTARPIETSESLNYSDDLDMSIFEQLY